MAHKEQRQFCETVKALRPRYFKNSIVLDVGSYDVNGNNKYLFENCSYTGIDVVKGKNVDVVCSGHEYKGGPFDTIISTECFEHDKYWKQTLKNMCNLLKPKGLLIFTCAYIGRPKHYAENGYYCNLSEQDIINCLNLDEIFTEYSFMSRKTFPQDLYFIGIKKG